MILQRLREAEDDVTFGEFAGTEGDLVSGIVQQGNDPRLVFVDLGTIEAVLPPQEQVPGEKYTHGTRLKCHVVSVAKTPRGPRVTVSRTHPNLVRSLFALEVPEIADGSVEIEAIAREAGHRTKIAVRSTVPGLNAKGACIGPMGAAGARRHGRAARREDRHRRLVRRPGRDRRQRAVAGPGHLGDRRRPRHPRRRASSCPTTSSRSPSARRARTPGSRPVSPAGASTSGPTPRPAGEDGRPRTRVVSVNEGPAEG